jgi:uncharacterized protein
MERKEIFVIVLFFVFALAFSYFFSFTNLLGGEGKVVNEGFGELSEVCFDGNCFDVEIADDDSERQRGLMFRESLDSDIGMLFVFDSDGVYPFWMKNTLVPLDIIWLSSDGEVVFISDKSAPCPSDGECPSINPNAEARYVLEIGGGRAREIGLEVGDKLDLNL